MNKKKYSVNSIKAKFITIEGGEGVGKTTIVRGLASYLSKLGLDVVTTREPGGTKAGNVLRKYLKYGESSHLSQLQQAVLLYAARHHHLKVVIRPALAEGKVVICDRFSDSTLAYQGFSNKENYILIKYLEKLVLGDTIPDFTIILSLTEKERISRLKKRYKDFLTQGKQQEGQPDNYEKQDLSYHQQVESAFRLIAADHPNRCKVIKAAQPRQKVLFHVINSLFESLATDLC